MRFDLQIHKIAGKMEAYSFDIVAGLLAGFFLTCCTLAFISLGSLYLAVLSNIRHPVKY